MKLYVGLDHQGHLPCFTSVTVGKISDIEIGRMMNFSREGLTSDHSIVLTGIKPKKMGLPVLRRIGYRDLAIGKHYEFSTNNFRLSAKTIADIYKQRWQIKLFFKWIKQNLKIKAFIGNTKNAVLTQIWTALCMVLLLAYLKFMNKLGRSLQPILRLLQLNLFMRQDLLELFSDKPPNCRDDDKQLCLI